MTDPKGAWDLHTPTVDLSNFWVHVAQARGTPAADFIVFHCGTRADWTTFRSFTDTPSVMVGIATFLLETMINANTGTWSMESEMRSPERSRDAAGAGGAAV